MIRFTFRSTPKKNEMAIFNAAYKNFEQELRQRTAEIQQAHPAVQNFITENKNRLEARALELSTEAELLRIEAHSSDVATLLRSKTDEMLQLIEALKTTIPNLLQSWDDVNTAYEALQLNQRTCEELLGEIPSSFTHLALRYMHVISSQAAEIYNEMHEISVSSIDKEQLTVIAREKCAQLAQLSIALTEKIPALLRAYDESHPMHPHFKEMTETFLSNIGSCKANISHSHPSLVRAARAHINSLILESLELSLTASQLKNVTSIEDDREIVRVTFFNKASSDAEKRALLEIPNGVEEPLTLLGNAAYENAWMKLLCIDMKALIKSLTRHIPSMHIGWQQDQMQKEHFDLAYQQFQETVSQCKNFVRSKNRSQEMDELLQEYISEVTFLAEEIKMSYAKHTTDPTKALERAKCKEILTLSTVLSQQINAWTFVDDDTPFSLLAMQSFYNALNTYTQKISITDNQVIQKSAFEVRNQFQQLANHLEKTYQEQQKAILIGREAANLEQKRLDMVRLTMETTRDVTLMTRSLLHVVNLLDAVDETQLNDLISSYNNTASDIPAISAFIQSLTRTIRLSFAQKPHRFRTTEETPHQTPVEPALNTSTYSPHYLRSAFTSSPPVQFQPIKIKLDLDLENLELDLENIETKSEDMPSPGR